jgi:hypothetical protein
MTGSGLLDAYRRVSSSTGHCRRMRSIIFYRVCFLAKLLLKRTGRYRSEGPPIDNEYEKKFWSLSSAPIESLSFFGPIGGYVRQIQDAERNRLKAEKIAGFFSKRDEKKIATAVS